MKSVFCLSSAAALLLLPLVAAADEKSHWKAAEELLELTTFYRTPTGQKAAQALPRLMAKGAQISRRRVEDNIDELRQLLALKANEVQETTENE